MLSFAKRVPQKKIFVFVYHTRFCLMASSWNIDLGSRMKSFVCPSSYFSCSFHLNFLAVKLIKTTNNKLFLPKSPLHFGNFFFVLSFLSSLFSLSLSLVFFYRRWSLRHRSGHLCPTKSEGGGKTKRRRKQKQKQQLKKKTMQNEMHTHTKKKPKTGEEKKKGTLIY